jgi:hypothetical protein
LEFGIFDNNGLVPSDKAANRLTSVILEALHHRLTATLQWNLKEHLTVGTELNNTLTAKSQQIVVDVAEYVLFTNVRWKFLAPGGFMVWHVSEVGQQVVVRQHVGLFTTNEYSINDLTDVGEFPFILAFFIDE